MTVSAHTRIRAAESDDAAGLLAVYDPRTPRAALLDIRREPVMPTCDELAEMLSGKEAARGQFYAVEDGTGALLGFCGLRGVNQESLFCEVMALFLDEESHHSPAGDEVADFLLERAFVRFNLQKVIATCLETEKGLRELLVRAGFESAGVQREVLYSGGRRLDLESLTRRRPETPPTGTWSRGG